MQAFSVHSLYVDVFVLLIAISEEGRIKNRVAAP